MVKAILVGEDNPYSSDPRHALYPYPANCAGERLQRLVLGVSVSQYFEDFRRVNLCVGRWRKAEAEKIAEQIFYEGARDMIPVVLLGAKVASAFGYEHRPFTTDIDGPTRIVQLPHPSGRCRAWNMVGAFERARAVLREAGAL